MMCPLQASEQSRLVTMPEKCCWIIWIMEGVWMNSYKIRCVLMRARHYIGEMLLNNLDHGGCVDEFLQDQVCIN